MKRHKTISTYDPAPSSFKSDADDYFQDARFLDTKLNGIRVWYSSFTSVDWLHDAIKESSRLFRLRSRKSLRGRLRSGIDTSIDWIVVTIIGFLTAIGAFLIVRSEQWFFDLKEGHCLNGWWNAKRFCSEWQEWQDAFASGKNGEVPDQWFGTASWAIEYIVYATIALCLATISSLLTIRFTASPSFMSDKDSGVLGPDFESSDKTAWSAPKRKVLYFAAGSGIPEIKTILSGFVIHGYLGARTLFTKGVGLALSVASGLSLGKEGPLVHIACCIGNIVSRYFPKYETNEGKRREILSSAAAAGVAVAFGAPIGGVLFSLEEVSYYFPPRVRFRVLPIPSFFCAMIAAITLRFLDPFGTGKLVLFQVTYDKDWHAFELVFFLILGIFGGVYGAYFSKLNIRWSRRVRNGTWLKSHPIAEVLLVTLVTTLLCFLNPYTRMGGTELVYNLFSECGPDNDWHEGLCPRDPIALAGPLAQSIGIALLVKGALTIVTFGIKLPAGIFIPTLGVGACFGRILGIGIQYLQYKHPNLRMFAACGGDMDCVVPGLYAMVGAAATLSGVTRTTVSLAVIMFELTDTLTYAVPVMLAVLTAKSVADALEPKGIYDLVIELSQLPYLDAKHEYLWGNRLASDMTDRNVGVIRLDGHNTVKNLRDKLREALAAGYADSGFPILRPDLQGLGLRTAGYIGFNELEHALAIVADDADAICYFNTASEIATRGLTSADSSFTESAAPSNDPLDFTVYTDQAPLMIQTNTPPELVQQLFAKLGAKFVIVTDPNGYYEGVIEKNAWIAYVNDLAGH
ncbi:clc channel [Fomitiporia mediterranea MF3/22]|uniref:clc channel n=1 Tax=Fomitiporia mediterranea (strain MF3/22) TaxID=694068 RepID=UPI0004408646|nr:clc channel [Fomitiporia mediterranea MF3/22]EJD03208.1 clc channel [Fomitiporia mediterranea MF3/22]